MAKKQTIGRRRPGRIFRQRQVEESIAKILRDIKVVFLVDESRFEKLHFPLADDKKAFHAALVLLSKALRGMFQLNAVYDQMIVAYRMAQRYPWDQRLIKRSEHLHFVWMVFTNLCYSFEEKFKLAAETHNSAAMAFKTAGQIKVKEGVNRISKGLREHIQARGEFTHQWRMSHEIIGQYSTIELVHSLGEMPKNYKMKTAYGLSRILILMEMEKAIRIVEDVLLDVIESHKKSLLPTSTTVTSTLKRMETLQLGTRRKRSQTRI